MAAPSIREIPVALDQSRVITPGVVVLKSLASKPVKPKPPTELKFSKLAL